MISSREIHLLSRPKGLPSLENFAITSVTISPPAAGQVLVRNLYMSVDPYMRGRMNDRKSYVPPFELGKVLEGAALGEVIESQAPGLKPGDLVTSNFGWREYFVAPPKFLRSVNPSIQPVSVYLGALGMTGMTAWSGLQLGELKAGDTIFISGAAGAVGSVAGQLAKLRGAQVIGSAGSEEKIAFLKEECGFHRAFNYKLAGIYESLKAAAPEGIDLYFDNVGGEALEAALSCLRIHGRIVACGSISGYNDEKPRPGPSNLFNMISKRLVMKGLLVLDWLEHWPAFEREVGGYIKTGKLKNRETVLEGIEQAVPAFLELFEGGNIGKMLVKLA